MGSMETIDRILLPFVLADISASIWIYPHFRGLTICIVRDFDLYCFPLLALLR
jgi:hypothetical protein